MIMFVIIAVRSTALLYLMCPRNEGGTDGTVLKGEA